MTATTQRGSGAKRLATGAGATLALAAVTVTTTGAPAEADDDYTVRPGDTVTHIAQRTGVSVASITRANALANPSKIYAGQLLRIPSQTPSRSAVRTAAPAAAVYTVRAGDTVSHIAKRTGSTIQAIVAANDLNARATILVGQRLQIPGASSAPAATTATATPAATTAAAATTYTVRAGDTVSAIAAQYGTTVSAIVQANGLGKNAMIRIGQRLAVPGATAPAATTARLVGDTFAGRTYASSVVDAANQNKAALLQAGVPSKATMQATIAATARKHGVDPRLAQAIAFQESGFNHTAVSPANAIGVMQVIPSSGEWASDLVGHRLDLLDPQDNVTAGVVILKALVRSAPDLPTAIAGYYQGAASVRRNGMFNDTRRYVANVQTLMGRF